MLALIISMCDFCSSAYPLESWMLGIHLTATSYGLLFCNYCLNWVACLINLWLCTNVSIITWFTKKLSILEHNSFLINNLKDKDRRQVYLRVSILKCSHLIHMIYLIDKKFGNFFLKCEESFVENFLKDGILKEKDESTFEEQ